MTSPAMAEVLRLLLNDRLEAADEVVAAGASALGVDSLAVSLVTGSGTTELLWCSAEIGRHFEDLQLTLGQGPGHDALRTGGLVTIADLARVRQDRWPVLAAEAPDLDVRAVFCFPMGLGALRVGVMTGVRSIPGPMAGQQVEDALALASMLTTRCLNGTDHATDLLPFAPPHTLQHAVIHQATGMLSVQLALPLTQALLRLRAHAYGMSRPITEVAQDIVDRRLRLDIGTNGHAPTPPAADKE
ncbi:ANTAR domain-containing protein [Streptacidiphilus sp. P02-A3a]|uniref:ANTAR domain-containing protein n=1 Tax=Streptacidiphilus sp. P02-A3a TaxID=2704468 RepID=UPI0015FDCF20|nr:ANTAR domain-containing protein [Streptacidiphilus sp. P02-A3a]QMU71758.1 ANTAR domain-containing protein [Streptacidiphilus sp. P02-A3a]